MGASRRYSELPFLYSLGRQPYDALCMATNARTFGNPLAKAISSMLLSVDTRSDMASVKRSPSRYFLNVIPIVFSKILERYAGAKKNLFAVSARVTSERKFSFTYSSTFDIFDICFLYCSNSSTPSLSIRYFVTSSYFKSIRRLSISISCPGACSEWSFISLAIIDFISE